MAQATFVSSLSATLSAPVQYYDAVFDRNGGVFAVGNNEFFSINVATGDASLIGTIAGDSVSAIGFVNGQLYGATVNGGIISIDTTTAATTFVSQENGLLGHVKGIASIPEPSSCVLLGPGAAGLFAVASRRRSKGRRRSSGDSKTSDQRRQ